MTAAAAQARAVPKERVACAHCDLPVPEGLIEPGEEHQFCCSGCRTVFGIVHSSGLDRYYALREQVGADARAAATTGRDFAEYDDPAYLKTYARAHAGGEMETTFLLEGVHCAACVWLVERLPRVAPGVVEARLDMRRSTVSVRWDAAATPLSRIAAALDSLGYPAHPPRGARREEIRQREDRQHLVRIGVAGALAGNTMLVAISLYAGVFDGMEDRWTTLFRWLTAGFGLLAVVWPGRVFFRGAIAALRTRTPHLDMPVSLALGVGAVWGLANAARGTGEVYFDSIATLVFLLLVGRWIQHAQQRRASNAVELLFTMTPTRATVVDEDDAERMVPIESVKPGDTVAIRSGETIPVDGEVLSGRSSVDAALISGESRPIPVAPGDRVVAGAVNAGSPLRVRAEAAGEETRVGRLMRLVADATAQKSPMIALADRLAGWFMLVVGGLAVMTASLWWGAGPQAAIEHATALLIVTCPCALGLATPLVMTVVLGRLARDGILVKGASALERLHRPGTIWFDKTGTLTEGRLTVAETTGDDTLWPAVAALERGDAHPAAAALRAHADPGGLLAEDAEHLPALGVRGRVAGDEVAAGSARLMDSLGFTIPKEIEHWSAGQAAQGRSSVFVARNGRVLAAASIDDGIRTDAAETLDRFRRAGWRTGLLSGDRPEVVGRVADALGFEPDLVCGGATPEEKLAQLQDGARGDSGSASRPTQVMIGDGVNDAAALAAADVGIAVQGGAEASLEAAMVYLRRPGLAPLEELLAGSRGAVRRIRFCLAASFAYNVVAATAAMLGLISPLFAAVLMPLSSLSVVAIAVSGAKSAPRASTEQGA